jgi:hypothetical protein
MVLKGIDLRYIKKKYVSKLYESIYKMSRNYDTVLEFVLYC